MDRTGALWGHVYPIILLVIDPCFSPLWPGLLLHPYGWLTRQLQLAAQVPYASFRNLPEKHAPEALECCEANRKDVRRQGRRAWGCVHNQVRGTAWRL